MFIADITAYGIYWLLKEVHHQHPALSGMYLEDFSIMVKQPNKRVCERSGKRLVCDSLRIIPD